MGTHNIHADWWINNSVAAYMFITWTSKIASLAILRAVYSILVSEASTVSQWVWQQEAKPIIKWSVLMMPSVVFGTCDDYWHTTQVQNIMQLQIDIIDLNIWHDSTSRDTWNWRTLAEWGHTPSRAFIMFIVSGAGRVFQTKRQNSSIICWLVHVWAPDSFCLIPTDDWS